MKNENPVYVMQTAIGTRYKKLYLIIRLCTCYIRNY